MAHSMQVRPAPRLAIRTFAWGAKPIDGPGSGHKASSSVQYDEGRSSVTSTEATARLTWLIGALCDPTSVTVADIAAAYSVPPEWRDWTAERELEFFATGQHSRSGPFMVDRIAVGEDDGVAAILVGADEKRWSLTCWTEPDPPHRITGARLVPAPPDGLTIRLAGADDRAALAELERRAPIRLGTDPMTFMTFDHGHDYFAASRLMNEVTIYVAEMDGRVLGVYCGAVQPVEVSGERKRLFLEHHVRIDPEAPRGGVFWALCSFGRDRYARNTDSIAFYVSVDNHALRKFTAGTPGWSVQPLRALIPCRRDDGAGGHGRPAASADASAVAGIFNGCHGGSALFAPYDEESLADRLGRDPDQYGWGDVLLGEGAAIGVGRELVTVTKETAGEIDVSRRALALDHGFLPGHDDDYRRLLQASCARLADLGATHLAVFTSERSSTYDVVADLADEIEVFDFWAFDITEPPSLAERGFYVDPVYF